MTSYIRGVIMSFIMFTSRFGIFITVLLYVTYVNRITVENVFFLTCYYNITKQTMTLYFPQAVGQVRWASLYDKRKPFMSSPLNRFVEFFRLLHYKTVSKMDLILFYPNNPTGSSEKVIFYNVFYVLMLHK